MIQKPNTKYSDCDKPAVNGVNYIPVHCDDHKMDYEQNLVEHPCKNCKLSYILDKNGFCEICNPETIKAGRM